MHAMAPLSGAFLSPVYPCELIKAAYIIKKRNSTSREAFELLQKSPKASREKPTRRRAITAR